MNGTTGLISRRDAAQAFSNAFEARTRDNGEEFACLQDDAPEWMKEAVQAAHGDMLPNDWRYRFIRQIVDGIAEALAYDAESDLADVRDHLVDDLVPVYNADRLQWLASNLQRVNYCDERAEEYGLSSSVGIIDRIAYGISAELGEIFDPIAAAIEAQSGE